MLLPFFVALRVMMSLDGYCWATVGCCLVNIIELNNTGNKRQLQGQEKVTLIILLLLLISVVLYELFSFPVLLIL